MKILSIESSCDETSAAVIENSKVLSNVISSQYFHSKYGGVIPELASRAHLEYIYEVVYDSLVKSNTKISEIAAIAVTTEPGLVGSLLVGSNFAKGLSVKYDIPVIPVNHIEGHLYSGCLQDNSLIFPFITLVVSGGHTALFFVESYTNYSLLGSTVDDAAGEAFDKIATLLGLEYPGGPQIDKLARTGNPKAYDFPRSMIHTNDYNFSFSGLKTSVRYFIHNHFNNIVPNEKKPDICASVQQAIVDVLVSKTVKLAKEKKVQSIVIAGGVSANSQLRKVMAEQAIKHGINVIAPDMQYCMDNAAMIGFLAEQRIKEISTIRFMDLTFKVNANALRAKKMQ